MGTQDPTLYLATLLSCSKWPLIGGRDMLLGIHRMLKRLVRALEAIPLHLSLSIVRLDDALGESWALPYQACQTFAVSCLFNTRV